MLRFVLSAALGLAMPLPAIAGDGSTPPGGAANLALTPLATITQYDCGDTQLRFGILGDRAALRLDGQNHALAPKISASGARYVGGAEDRIEFWSKGNTAMLTVDGKAYPECQSVEQEAASYRARGNEPGWHVTVGDDAVEVVAQYGEVTKSSPRPEAMFEDEGYILDMPGIEARLRIEDGLCHDDMSGMPYPQRAVLTLAGAEYRGCAGEARDLLTGTAWHIEDVMGGGVIDGAEVTIGFDAEGRAFGRAACNRFSGGYDLTGEGISFGPMAATKMACPPALMDLETKVFEALSQVWRFDFDETGALLLIGGPEGEALLTARR